MQASMPMDLQFRSPRNPLEWIVAVVAVAIVVSVGVVMASVAIVAIGIAILVAPIVGWWRRRHPPEPPLSQPGEQRILDVEFEVEEEEPSPRA